jgi:hypothetical protein
MTGPPNPETIPEEEPVYIDAFQIENAKRVKAVKIDCKGEPLTIIGGGNRQGKTSILNTLAYLFGGERFRPSNLKRDDALSYPAMKAILSNGLIVERKGINSSLKVTDPEGKEGGQTLLNRFIPTFALDLRKFLEARPAEKADMMLQSYEGVAEKYQELQAREDRFYQERLAIGRIADQKKKHADELPHYPDAPEEIVTARKLIEEQQQILAKNGENQRLRNRVDHIRNAHTSTSNEVKRLRDDLAKAEARLDVRASELGIAIKTAEQLEDESTAEIEAKLNEIDAINVQVRANMDKENANQEAEEHTLQYEEMTNAISAVRDEKKSLLDGVDLPLPGLSVDKGELLYEGKAWDCMAGSDQYKVATSIVKKRFPKCGFVLIDKLEALDLQTLHEFGSWLQQEGLQAITTRVSEGEECSIIIEDGFSMEDGQKTLVHGEF